MDNNLEKRLGLVQVPFPDGSWSKSDLREPGVLEKSMREHQEANNNYSQKARADLERALAGYNNMLALLQLGMWQGHLMGNVMQAIADLNALVRVIEDDLKGLENDNTK